MKDSESTIDPRYDPAFQRGYDHGVHGVHGVHGGEARLRPVEAVRKVLSREPRVTTTPIAAAPLAAPKPEVAPVAG